jgi:hypothetical protein
MLDDHALARELQADLNGDQMRGASTGKALNSESVLQADLDGDQMRGASAAALLLRVR